MLEGVVCSCLDDLNIQICDLSNKEGISESLLILSSEFIFGDGTEVENTTIKFYKVSNFYNLEFVNLEKTTSSFNELQKLLSKENIENIQDWNVYPSINMLSNENGEYFGKIQISDKDCLKINFPVYNDKIFNVLTIVKEQIKLILIGLGYQENNIQLSDSIAMIDLSKINIIGNISDDSHINSLKTRFSNKAIFIACGLEHDLASVSKQKIVKEFKTRIIESHDRISRDDYIEIGENLATNNKLKQLRESINKCYHQADFFLNYESDKNSPLSKYKMKQQLKRFFNLLHGFQFATPTKDEYAMHLAFSSALRSADLSRQVGAVITSSNGDILATGTNDIPKSGGGLYCSRLNEYNGGIYDDSLGRDYMRGFDSNACEKSGLIDNIYNAVQPYLKDEVSEESLKEIISKSKLKDITEYGRVVHAEMEALMACARGQVSSNGAILYCTTFPCHNCAKHIIAAGIKRVVYIEPYAKSKALPFHFDSVVDEEINPIEDLIKDKLSDESQNKVLFESFIGVGPNLFRQLFKMRDDSRKDKNGLIKPWTPQLINP